MANSIGGRRGRAASDEVLHEPADAAISAFVPNLHYARGRRRERLASR
jgi:hypothetical protein